MANEKHVALLQQGVNAWNRWRAENPGISPDLSGANLIRARLNGADLNGADLNGADLSDAYLKDINLVGANLREAKLVRANLYRALLRGADLMRAHLSWTDITGANLNGANLSKASLGWANLNEATLIGIDLRSADLKGANLDKAQLCKGKLNEANLLGAHLYRTNVQEANLSSANLSGAKIIQSNMHQANLSHARLQGASLIDTNLTNADLRGVDFRDVNLSGSSLNGSDLDGAALYRTVLGDVYLADIKNLDKCKHLGPSTIDHFTLRKSGELSITFLRGVGLPDNIIDYLPSLLNQPIVFYSCFISYSAKDQAFAERLHADLQNKGVRCWFAPHDMPIGAKILDALDEAIRLRDRVLLILSESAIASDWVEDEVSKAFAEERDRGKVVLFPVRLDDVVLQTAEPWARKLRDQRNIGDFTRWKDYDAYRRSFERVLRDLTVPQVSEIP